MKKVFFALGLVVLSNIAFAQATPIKFDDAYSIAGVLANPCSGELVDFNIEGTFSVRGTMNKNRASLNIHQSEKYDGVGQTSGNNYSGHGQANQHQNIDLVDGYGNANGVLTVIITTSGGGNNYKVRQTFHITVNANGVVTVNRGSATVECQ